MPKELRSWYKLIPKSLCPQYDNPRFKDHGISVPFRSVVVGSSGSGKTQLVLEVIHRMSDTFGHITVCCMNADEPLYKFLASKIRPEQLTVAEGYSSVPDLDSLDPDVQHLVIFDDLVLERNQDRIAQYFVRGRKIARGVSCLYLTQSYWLTPKVIRLQASYVILKKLASTRDLNLVMRDCSLGLKKDEMLKLYKDCTEDPQSFLMIDMNVPHEQRFRQGFTNVLNLDN